MKDDHFFRNIYIDLLINQSYRPELDGVIEERRLKEIVENPDSISKYEEEVVCQSAETREKLYSIHNQLRLNTLLELDHDGVDIGVSLPLAAKSSMSAKTISFSNDFFTGKIIPANPKGTHLTLILNVVKGKEGEVSAIYKNGVTLVDSGGAIWASGALNNKSQLRVGFEVAGNFLIERVKRYKLKITPRV